MIIYKITNVVNGKFYIGKTTLTIEERFKTHFYKHKSGKTHLYKAMRKYGFENFTIEPIETDVFDLNEAETRLIAELKPHYNMTTGGDGGNTALSPNFKRSMTEYHSRKPISEYATYGMSGKPHPMKGKSNARNYCPVSCDGILFDSVGQAQEYFVGISIRKRLDSDKYPNFYRLKPKTVRK